MVTHVDLEGDFADYKWHPAPSRFANLLTARAGPRPDRWASHASCTASSWYACGTGPSSASIRPGSHVGGSVCIIRPCMLGPASLPIHWKWGIKGPARPLLCIGEAAATRRRLRFPPSCSTCTPPNPQADTVSKIATYWTFQAGSLWPEATLSRGRFVTLAGAAAGIPTPANTAESRMRSGERSRQPAS